ncbi:MAG: hypothetical protein CL933_14735 [Deltaproteobacteria bacterium]|nr:hypothetical protein [Deltaproteobacteria bacterium]
MSNPISTLPEDESKSERHEPGLEVDEIIDGDTSVPLLEFDAIEPDFEPSQDPSADLSTDATMDGHEAFGATDEVGTQDSVTPSADASRRRSGPVALLLAALLLGSVVINLKQSRDVATLEMQSAEFERALSDAIERVEIETARADGAEAALERVDGAVDVVNSRVLGLQEALDGLREATLR